METRNALRLALSMSGKYDTGRKLAVSAYDMYGKPMTEEILEIDAARMESDIDAILRGDMPSPIRSFIRFIFADSKLPTTKSQRDC